MAVALRELDRGRRWPALRVMTAPAPPPTPRHVYWLRRALVVFIAVGLTMAVVSGVRALGSSPAEPVVRTNVTVVVQPGQTLWNIAARYLPEDGDLQGLISEISELNDVDGRTLRPGTPLVVPVESAAVTATLQGDVGR